ncbi:MAG: DMT family transporter [Muribaculaceae bacterium]|nr:DMT family transporter [Muribaculaceae bacterium]MDE6521941.1 DMT family transporter [Muribaculaceae bacterium]
MNTQQTTSDTSASPKGTGEENLKVDKRGRLVGNVSMFIAKTFSGLNENALKYLLPTWMNAYTGVVLRLGFGSLFFWILGWVRPDKTEQVTMRDRLLLLLTGIIAVFGYMYTLLIGLTYTTPISSSIFIALQATVVYIICLILRTDRLSTGRLIGIFLGIGGALICILTQKHSEVASNPLLGNMFCLLSTFLFSAYLVIEKKFLKRLSNATVSKYTFSGGLLAGIVAVIIAGKWFAPVLTSGVFSTPFLVLAFVLLFPTSLSYLLTDVGLKKLPATVVALYSNWILIVAAIVSYVLGQDKFSWWQIISIILIIASVFLVESAEAKDHKQS